MLIDIQRVGSWIYTSYIAGGYLPKVIEQPALNYFEDDDRRNALKNQINAYVEDSIQKWILGMENPQTNYTQFIQTLKKLGVDEYIAINRKAYDNYLREFNK